MKTSRQFESAVRAKGVQTEKDLSAVIVTYNSYDVLGGCLESLYAAIEDLDAEVFLVDNASTDGGVQLAREEFPDTRVIRNTENIGFAAANNQAIRQARGRYVLLLNPDTVVKRDSLESLVELMDERSDVGASSCRLLSADGSTQPSIRNFPTLLNQLGETFFLHRAFPGQGALSEVANDLSLYQEEQDVDWLSGAALMLRTDALAEIGLLDEGFFLYSEEVDLCLRLRQSGWRLLYSPRVEIVHYGGDWKANPKLLTLLYRSRLRFFNKHYPRTAGLYRSLAYLQLLLRACIWFFPAKALNNKEAGLRLDAYWRCLKSVTFKTGPGAA